MKWLADVVLSVTSRLLDSLMEPCRAGRSVRLWIILYTPVPDHKLPISRTIASALMRRRSQQLLSRLLRFRNFSGFSARCTTLKFWNSNGCFRTESRSTSERFSVCADVSPTAPATASTKSARNAMAVKRQQVASRAGRSPNCVSKVVIRYLVQQRVPRTLLSEIVRPSPEAAELLYVSAPLAAAATRVRVDESGDVVMTPAPPPNNEALSRAIRLSGGSDDAIQAAQRFDALFANVSQNPLLFLPLLSDVGQKWDNVWHLTSSCVQTSQGSTVCFWTCWTWPVTIRLFFRLQPRVL